MKPKSIASSKACWISSGRKSVKHRKTQKLKNRKTFGVLFAFFGFFVFPFFGLAYANYEEGMSAYRKAWAAFARQRYDDARRWTAQAVQADPTNPHAHALAGDLAYLAHDLAGARRAWEHALKAEPRLRPLQERLMQVAQEERADTGQALQRAGVFHISAPAGATVDLRKALDELQAAQAFLERRLPCRLEGPISVLVYDPEVFYGSLHVPTEVAGLFDGKIRLPLFRGQDIPTTDRTIKHPVPVSPSFKAVIWHELAHAAVHQLAHGAAPRWVHEGVAQAVQEQVEPIPTDALRIAFRRKDVPSLKLLEGRSADFGQAVPIEAGVFYQTAWAQVAYLLEHRGWTGLRRLLDELGAGRASTEALQQVTALNEDAWMRQWHRWVQERLEGE